MGFIGSTDIADSSTETQTPTAAVADVTTDGFFPAVSLASFREVMRVDDKVSNKRTVYALRLSARKVNESLSKLKADALANGADTLLGLYDTTEEQEEKTDMYMDAVFNEAKARILEDYRDISTTTTGLAKSKAIDPRIDDCRQRVYEAIKYLTGADRTDVELI